MPAVSRSQAAEAREEVVDASNEVATVITVDSSQENKGRGLLGNVGDIKEKKNKERLRR